MRKKSEGTESQQKANSNNAAIGAHILLKVRTENGQTITAHADMVTKSGAAMLGKIGQAVGPDFREALNKQIESGIKTYLFLTIREGWNGPYVTYRCLLRQVSEALDAEKKSLVPRYYLHEIPKIKTWFEITSVDRLTRDEMNRIFVLSSGRSVMSVVNSSATIFRVGIEKGK